MRTIKFRARHNGKWVFGHYHYTVEYPNSVRTHNISNKNGTYENIDIETLGQFTGLLDKNGNEIYEGDRIDEFEIIEWCTNSNGWQVAIYDIPTKDKILCHCYNCEGNYDLRELVLDRSLEVIGNIHDNSKQ